jgi:hypothetical protein
MFPKVNLTINITFMFRMRSTMFHAKAFITSAHLVFFYRFVIIRIVFDISRAENTASL